VLPATVAVNSLTVNNAAAPQYGLAVGPVWWTLSMVLVAINSVVVDRLFWGKVRLADASY
jgi:hypothetical protein